MSEKPSEPKPAARALNRWGIGTLSILQLALLLLILAAANYLSIRYYQRKDFSREGNYALSSSTERYLAESPLKERTAPVKWIMAFRRSSPFYERVRAIAEEYERQSGGKIQLEIVDPLRSPDRTAEVAAGYGLTLLRDLIIIDARDGESPAVTEDATGTRSLDPHIKLAIAEEMVTYATDAKGQRRPTGFQGEDILTARLVEAIEGKPRRMLFLADKSRLEFEGENSPWKSLETTLRFQNISLEAVQLSGMAGIPADVEGVALVAPKYDLTDAELNVLESYWNRPRSALLILLQPGEVPAKLRAFLRGNGVTPRRDRIVGREGDRLVASARGTFSYGIDFLKDLAGQTAVFDGASSSLEVREGAEDLLNRRISPFSLVEVASGFWGETKFGEGNETFDEREDNRGPLHLAASVTRGAATDDKLSAETSRMIVIANTDFLDPDRQRAENIDFLAASVNWLVGRESLAGIGPRSLGTYKLPILEAQVSFINKVNFFFLPGFIFLIGLFVWSSRRA